MPCVARSVCIIASAEQGGWHWLLGVGPCCTAAASRDPDLRATSLNGTACPLDPGMPMVDQAVCREGPGEHIGSDLCAAA